MRLEYDLEAPAAQDMVLGLTTSTHSLFCKTWFGAMFDFGLILVKARRQHAVGGNEYLNTAICFIWSQWLPWEARVCRTLGSYVVQCMFPAREWIMDQVSLRTR